MESIMFLLLLLSYSMCLCGMAAGDINALVTINPRAMFASVIGLCTQVAGAATRCFRPNKTVCVQDNSDLEARNMLLTVAVKATLKHNQAFLRRAKIWKLAFRATDTVLRNERNFALQALLPSYMPPPFEGNVKNSETNYNNIIYEYARDISKSELALLGE